MLLIIQIEKLHHQTLKDMEDEKEIIIIGKGLNLCFNDNYFEEIEEKARKYDELMEEDERLREKNERIEKELEPLREKANAAKKKQKEFLEKLDEMISEAKKSDFRKVAKKGIPYKNKNYTFDGWENHIGEIINFEVFDDYLILNLEGQILHATTQDI